MLMGKIISSLFANLRLANTTKVSKLEIIPLIENKTRLFLRTL